jgi:hypothetical protein
VLEVTSAKEIKGTVQTPPSSDLFFLSMVIAAATGSTTTISPITPTPRITAWADTFVRHLDITFENDACRCAAPALEPGVLLTLDYTTLPYRDFVIFLLLGRYGELCCMALPAQRFAVWKKYAEKLGCTLEQSDYNGTVRLALGRKDHFHIPDVIPDSEEVMPYLGLAMGLRKPLEFSTDYVVSNPLREVLPVFGWECSVKSPSRNNDADPLARRLRFLTKNKKSDNPQQFTITADFSKQPLLQANVILPGDDVFAALMVAAKCLITKGSLIIGNVCLESWCTSTIALVRSMGSNISIQQTHSTSYGSTGTVIVQKFNPLGRKVECSPNFQYVFQLPAMTVTAAFAHGQTILRGLEDLRRDEPDGIETLNDCIAALGARYGEMPDGIVVQGARQFDGFDLLLPLPAYCAGAFVIAGLKCIGTTTINDEDILRRWPHFQTMLWNLCEFKE